MTTTADLLNEYAQALRGDWGDIDGRSEKISLNELAALIRLRGNDILTDSEVHMTREDLGVCLEGAGHWQMYCEDDLFECAP